MTFLRKDRIVLEHYCEDPEKELKCIQSAVAIGSSLMDDTTEMEHSYQQLIKAMKNTSYREKDQCLVIEVLLEPVIFNNYDPVFQHIRLMLFLNDMKISVVQKQHALAKHQLKGGAADHEANALFEKAYNYLSSLSKSVKIP